MSNRRSTDNMGYPPVSDSDERYVPRMEFAAYMNELHNKLDGIADDVGEIKTQVKQTNGRVTKLELWKARAEGGRAAIGTVGAALVTIFASSVCGAAVYILSH